MYITIEQAKQHLNVDEYFTLDDDYILSLISVAECAVENHIDNALEELTVAGKLPAPLVHSMLLLIGNLYTNRENVTYQQYYKIPLSYEYLLSPYIRY